MFDKLMEAQQKAGEIKSRLDAITVTGTAEGGKINVTANGNKLIQSVNIDADFFKDAKQARKSGVSVVKGISIAVATDSRSAADTKMHSNGPDKK